jgi:hypothetical protein
MKLRAFVLVMVGCWPLAAQNNWCSNQGWHSDGQIQHSEVREEHLAPAAENVVDPAQNGSIRVHGWANNDILVRACVQGTGISEGAAEAMVKQVTVTDGPGRIIANGPKPANNSWWNVSYDIWVPAAANLQLTAFNGSIHVEGTAGKIHAHTLNGSVKLKDVAGDVDGETTNGSLTIELAAGGWHGTGLKLNTTNGSINLQLPSSIGAEVEASTVHGRVKSDFSEGQSADERQNVTFTIGGGGPKIEAHTVNGSVQISRQS